MTKVEYSDSNYTYYSDVFDGHKITFRVERATGDVYALLDDNFARANGYADVGSLINTSMNYGEPIVLTSRWLKVGLDGSWTASAMRVQMPTMGEA